MRARFRKPLLYPLSYGGPSRRVAWRDRSLTGRPVGRGGPFDFLVPSDCFPLFRKTFKFKVPSIQTAIDCTNGCDTAFQQATVPPGGSSGWHTHPGATFVAIGQGEITYYHVDGTTCYSEKVSAGSGFGQMPTEVHVGRNESSANLVIYTLYVLPSGTPNSGIRIDQPQPAGCPDVH
jgi:hypothetical protein